MGRLLHGFLKNGSVTASRFSAKQSPVKWAKLTFWRLLHPAKSAGFAMTRYKTGHLSSFLENAITPFLKLNLCISASHQTGQIIPFKRKKLQLWQIPLNMVRRTNETVSSLLALLKNVFDTEIIARGI